MQHLDLNLQRCERAKYYLERLITTVRGFKAELNQPTIELWAKYVGDFQFTQIDKALELLIGNPPGSYGFSLGQAVEYLEKANYVEKKRDEKFFSSDEKEFIPLSEYRTKVLKEKKATDPEIWTEAMNIGLKNFLRNNPKLNKPFFLKTVNKAGQVSEMDPYQNFTVFLDSLAYREITEEPCPEINVSDPAYDRRKRQRVFLQRPEGMERLQIYLRAKDTFSQKELKILESDAISSARQDEWIPDKEGGKEMERKKIEIEMARIYLAGEMG